MSGGELILYVNMYITYQCPLIFVCNLGKVQEIHGYGKRGIPFFAILCNLFNPKFTIIRAFLSN